MSDRPGIDLDFDDESEVDIEKLANTKREKPKFDKNTLNEVSEKSGFVSRQASKPRRRRGARSPYTQQKNFKMRPEMPELFADIADSLAVKDYELLEMALQAFLTKQKMKEELERFKKLTS